MSIFMKKNNGKKSRSIKYPIRLGIERMSDVTKENQYINKILEGDCVKIIKDLVKNDIRVNLTVTSPPYDTLRNYNGYIFDFKNIAKGLYDITKEGGVVVWVVGDKIEKSTDRAMNAFNCPHCTSQTGIVKSILYPGILIIMCSKCGTIYN